MSVYTSHPLAAAIAVAVSLPAALPAAAQTAPAAQPVLPEVRVGATRDSDYATGISSVGGKLPEALRDIPQTVNVVNRAVLEAQGATSLTDALLNVPGITIGAGEGGQIGNNINLRGFSARTDIYLDGMRDRGQYSRDTFFLEAVEVLKGPASMLFGRGSTGGVINQSSKRATLRPVDEVTATVGTDSYYRVTADVGSKLSDTAALRLNAFGQDIKSTRDVVQNKDYGAAPSLRLGIGTPTEITVSGLFQHNSDVPDYGFPLVGTGVGTVAHPVKAPANRFYGYADDYFKQDVQVVGLTVEHKLTPTTRLRNQTQFSNYRIDASPTPLGTVSVAPGAPAGTTVNWYTPLQYLQAQRQDRNRTVDDRSLFNQTEVITEFATGAIGHKLTAGAEVGTDSYRFKRTGWTPTNVNVNLGDPATVDRAGSTFLSSTTNTDASTVAFFANDEVALTKQWKLVAGLRYDRYHSEQTGYDYVAKAPANLPGRTDAKLSPRLGVLYQPDEVASYYASFGTSFNPSAETVTVTAANVNVAPEKNRSFETGGKWDLDGGALSLAASVFRIEKTDARTTDPVTGLVDLTGKVRVQGFEVSAAGKLTDTVQLLAGYTLLDSEILSSKVIGTGNNAGLSEKGHAYPNTPRHNATLWATWKPLGEVELGAGSTLSSKRTLNNFETAEIAGYARFDATAAWIQRKYTLRLNLRNLTDAYYFEGASGGRATPTRGRTALLSLAYRF
ncbi:TonB-dependent receptor [Derxia lacustris]|uniref:TonB-dependent receptor n=1 Tax=Derxia lacustris TaxID=764842 RepID=UPI000A16D84E|nr:TonB-dependent siderophore receptor [Derxia lacustris]